MAAHGLLKHIPSKRLFLVLKVFSKAKSEEKIFSPDEIEMLKDEVRRRIDSGLKRFGDYYINGYAMLFAIESLLNEINAKQEKLGIESEFIFCNSDGRWILPLREHLVVTKKSFLSQKKESPENLNYQAF
ncbi:MAG: hypothetical protein K6E79_04140 [Pseudobutyrivibrio sp.]|nr:hypothetical protein [Pseudobutyrivibrio sp.]